jgi:2,3-diketo-5-methylthio-1-phosphopentane phosphatase
MLLLPEPDSSQVLIDFDGTISRIDVLDRLIERFAPDGSWKDIEEKWQAGLIGSRECLSEEFAMLRVRKEQVRDLLSKIPLDPGVTGLFEMLEAAEVPVAILSDGVDFFIQRLLARVGLAHIPVRANAIRHQGDRIELRCPHSNACCESAAAHCKCASMKDFSLPGRKSIYIGDGRSDLCPARKADVVFAKGVLAESLALDGIDFIPYGTLDDVTDVLANAWAQWIGADLPDVCHGSER